MQKRGPLWIAKYRKHIRLQKFSKLKIAEGQEIAEGIKSSRPVPSLLWHTPVAGQTGDWVSQDLGLCHEQPFQF